MSYYNPRLIGGALDAGAIPKTGLAIFFAIMLALGCAGAGGRLRSVRWRCV